MAAARGAHQPLAPIGNGGPGAILPTISAGSGSTWWPHVLHHTINRTFAFAALPSVIGGPGGDFTGLAL